MPEYYNLQWGATTLGIFPDSKLLIILQQNV